MKQSILDLPAAKGVVQPMTVLTDYRAVRRSVGSSTIDAYRRTSHH